MAVNHAQPGCLWLPLLDSLQNAILFRLLTNKDMKTILVWELYYNNYPICIETYFLIAKVEPSNHHSKYNLASIACKYGKLLALMQSEWVRRG